MRGMIRTLVAVAVLGAVLVLGSACADGGDTRTEREGRAFWARSEADYVGSERCGECHDRIYSTWSGTLHAQIVQRVEDNPQIILGNFESQSATRTFDVDQIVVTHGVQWKQRYIDEDWRVFPAQWNFDTRTWTPYNPDTWEESDWRTECAYCHAVGYDRDTNEWAELGIGCEACHGPGSAHSDDPSLNNIHNPARMPRAFAADVCGQCHTRGSSADGESPFPVGYRVGDQLTDAHFTPVGLDNEAAWWPDGGIRQHRQQHPQWRDTAHFRAGVDCVRCHEVHTRGAGAATRQERNNLCRECHGGISTHPVTGHAPIAGAPQHSNCVACHMPPIGKSAIFGDEHDHRFRVIPPSVTIELGNGDPDVQPNSCNTCHYHAEDDPQDLQDALSGGLEQRQNASDDEDLE